MSTNRLEEIDVRNYMHVRKAHLIIDGNTIVVSGENEQGKSSFLRSIEDLFGGKDASPAMPIRRGAKEATVVGRLKCADGRVLKATLTHTKDNRRIVITDEDGKVQPSPQTILAAFWAETSFDPSLFLVSKPDEQVRMLKKMGGLDFAKLDTEKATIFAQRTTINRDADRLKTIAASKPSFPDAPKTEQSATDIIAEIDAAKKHNERGTFLDSDIKTRAGRVESSQESLAELRADAKEIEEEISRLQVKLREKQGYISRTEESIVGETAAMNASKQSLAEFTAMDLAPLQAKLAAVEETNRKVRANVDKAKSVADARAKEAEAQKITDRLQEIEDTKGEQLRAAKFPIAGMSFDESGVTINGVPLEQESDMRKIAIGVEMAAAMNPEKALMLVRHGNLFTPQNFHILEEIAQKRNLTCIVEIPGTNVAGSKLVFEDGVGVVPGEAAPAESQPELPVS